MGKCSKFVMYDEEPDEPWMALMRCPACKGWLPRDWPIGKQFACKRCGAVLETMPSIPEDDDIPEDIDYEWGGRLCVVPDVAITYKTPDKGVDIQGGNVNG